MAQYRYIFVVAVIGLIGQSDAAKRIHLIPDTFETWSDNEYVNFSHAIDTSVPYINMTYKILKQMEDIEMHVESEITSRNERNHFFRSNATFSICDMLALRSVHPLTVLAFATANRNGHLPQKCPIETGTYKFTKMWPPEENIPGGFPEMQMEFKLQLFAIDNGAKHMVVNNRIVGHTSYKEGSDSFFSMLKG